jgi:DNA-binding NtrC family response regulator
MADDTPSKEVLETWRTMAGQRTILLVEDEVLIRTSTAQYFRSSGFQVLEAMDVKDATLLLNMERGIDVVFTDVKLPGNESGLDLARSVQTNYPRVRVLVTSGVIHESEARGVDAPLLESPTFCSKLSVASMN